MLQNMLPLHITQIYVVQQQIIKNNIKKFTILSKDKTARNNSNENEPLQ